MTEKAVRETNENKVQTQLEDMLNSYMELLAGQKMIQQQLQGMMEQMQSQNKNGKTELWFQGLVEGKGMPTWNQFVQAVYERFDGTYPWMILGEFNKLRQTNVVIKYLEQFADLKAHVTIYNPKFPDAIMCIALSVDYVMTLKVQYWP
ncbi:hypothetical protein Salat_2929100 [Sesamum alatum]|uniref:Retrotransposon gag domain-containing protein n=1 Tax=Sesamum alatum TaxID=300844 RepID=A0AAE2C8C5_9LAMI|nr:hypothetical protein Salat_2929100 [Sesamum alatum]